MGPAHNAPTVPDCAHTDNCSLEERLERGDVVYFPQSPFALPVGADLEFMLAQSLASRAHKNISFDPRTAKAAGYTHHSAEQSERLRKNLEQFSLNVTDWMRRTFPAYSKAWQLDRVSYRPEEEATRKLRHKARNDLLHVDAFPSRPTQGWRILRVFANINPVDPRIWVTSDPFSRLLERFGTAAGLPGQGRIDWTREVGQTVLRIFQPKRPRRSTYDSFMIRFHDYLKANDSFQERGPKRFWSFPPMSAWLAMTDTASHAVLRGRYALEHSYFIAPHSLALPAESPAALLERACGKAVLPQAA